MINSPSTLIAKRFSAAIGRYNKLPADSKKKMIASKKLLSVSNAIKDAMDAFNHAIQGGKSQVGDFFPDAMDPLNTNEEVTIIEELEKAKSKFDNFEKEQPDLAKKIKREMASFDEAIKQLDSAVRDFENSLNQF